MRLPTVRSGSVSHQHMGRMVGGVGVFWVDDGQKVLSGCLSLFPWSFSMWKWSPVFTVRDLALLSSRWSRSASERAPSPQSLQLSPSSLFSHPFHFLFSSSILSFIQNQSPPPLFPFFLSSLAASHFEARFVFFFISFPSPLPHVPCPPSLLSPTFLLPPSLPSFASHLSSSFFLCVVECQRGEKGWS